MSRECTDADLRPDGDYRRSTEYAGVKFVRCEKLRHARFEGATLDGADFTDSNLDGASFFDASLRGAKLSGVRNLSTEALGGADLTGAQLPHDWKFEGLDGVSEASKYLQSLFKIILALCAFSVLTIFSTPDELLILREAPHGARLPFISAAVAPRHFGWIAPVIILTLFVYLVTYLAETWVQLSKLPAVFPDGSPLDRRAYPLSLNCLIRRYSKRLQESPPVSYEVKIAYVFMFGVSLPTLLFFYGSYLKLHSWSISLVQAACVSIAIQLALYHWVISIVVLGERGWRTEGTDWAESGGHPASRARKWFLVLFDAATMLMSEKPASGKPERLGWWRSCRACTLPGGLCFLALVPITFAAFRIPWLRVDIAHKVVSQVVASDGQTVISGADLERINLRNAQAGGTYLQNADLEGVDFRGADLTDADLRGAILDGADLTGAVISGCNFEGSSVGIDQILQAKSELRNPPKLPPEVRLAFDKLYGTTAGQAGRTETAERVPFTVFEELDVSVQAGRPSTAGPGGGDLGRRETGEIQPISTHRR